MFSIFCFYSGSIDFYIYLILFNDYPTISRCDYWRINANSIWWFRRFSPTSDLKKHNILTIDILYHFNLSFILILARFPFLFSIYNLKNSKRTFTQMNVTKKYNLINQTIIMIHFFQNTQVLYYYTWSSYLPLLAMNYCKLGSHLIVMRPSFNVIFEYIFKNLHIQFKYLHPLF